MQYSSKAKQFDRQTALAVLAIVLYLVAAGTVFLVFGEKMRIAVPDNLDLFQAQYQMLKNEDLFAAQSTSAPFLHGVTRDDLPSELSLPGLLYRFLPSFYAYALLYLLKVVLAVVSFVLLFRELLERNWLPGMRERTGTTIETDHRVLVPVLLCGFAYGILNLFPAFGISFSSVPLLVYFLLRLERESSILKRVLLYLGIFLYPCVSYFSYFGLFLLAYMALALIVLSIARRRPDLRMLAAILLLSAGFMLFEYRLFRSMLFSHEVTIRSTMVIADLDAGGILSMIREVLLNGGAMHTRSMQQYIVLPVCLLYFLLLNIRYLLSRKASEITRDVYNWGVLLLLFDSLIYGLYYCGPFRRFIEMLLPPLNGWQFGRTSFLNPFLWYALFCIAMVRFSRCAAPSAASEGSVQPDTEKIRSLIRRLLSSLAVLLCLLSCAVILLRDTDYNDLYHTAHAEANRLLRGVTENSLTYGEFYSEALFDRVTEEIGYDGEWSAAYGFHPANLEYNGIRTIDGYLGFYLQDYKDSFRRIIAPALEKQPATMAYYDNWGARCYLYSGNHSTIVEAVRNYPHPEDAADLDIAAMKALDCRYIFSRPCITNARELGLTLLGSWADDTSPYVVYVYEIP